MRATILRRRPSLLKGNEGRVEVRKKELTVQSGRSGSMDPRPNLGERGEGGVGRIWREIADQT